eukprot:TRINITY_DN27587_c0_g1_i10.p1 TRINITY_DN27587_c0_g1~~TRINITY_DN27587_c0_g1_i10.p1  ORF type:complete len:682 (+),score=116.76 TRINITY_DN27587_c0_g1_i10:77-2047(+)
MAAQTYINVAKSPSAGATLRGAAPPPQRSPQLVARGTVSSGRGSAQASARRTPAEEQTHKRLVCLAVLVFIAILVVYFRLGGDSGPAGCPGAGYVKLTKKESGKRNIWRSRDSTHFAFRDSAKRWRSAISLANAQSGVGEYCGATTAVAQSAAASSGRQAAAASAGSGAGANLVAGQAVTVLSKSGAKRQCTVLQAEPGRVLVHYNGFLAKYDEWLPRDSSRIVQAETAVGAGTAAQAPAAAPPAPAPAAGVQPTPGTSVRVLSKSGLQRTCTVVAVKPGEVQVHYNGFSNSYDEWIPLSSPRYQGVIGPTPAGAVPPAPAPVVPAAPLPAAGSGPPAAPPVVPPALPGAIPPAAPVAAPPAAPAAADVYTVGAKIHVLSKSGVKRICTVIAADATRVQVHYEGFTSAYDEWLERTSTRLQGAAADTPAAPPTPAAAVPVPSTPAAQPSQALVPPSPAGTSVTYAVGNAVYVLSKRGNKRLCRVVGVDTIGKRLQVHFEGFAAQYDEWIDFGSNRLLGKADGSPAAAAPAPVPAPVPAVAAPAAPGVAPPPVPRIGQEITVVSLKGVKRKCTVVDVEGGRIKVHYIGFRDKYDEWVELSSPRYVGPEGSTPAAQPASAPGRRQRRLSSPQPSSPPPRRPRRRSQGVPSRWAPASKY